MSDDRFTIPPPPPGTKHVPATSPASPGTPIVTPFDSGTHKLSAAHEIPAPVATTAPTQPPTVPVEPAAPSSLLLQGGQVVPLSGEVVIGRGPTAPAEHPGAVPVAVDDPAKSVSKTHALVTAAPVAVRDLASTNGTTVQRHGGEAAVDDTPYPLEVGDVVWLGEFRIDVR